jgi:hypothetical protein
MAPAGGGLVLLYSRDAQTTRVVRGEVAELLDGMREFRALDDHSRALAGDRIGRHATVRRELERLARDGFLVTPPDPSGGTAPAPLHISTHVVPTCGRVTTLERTLESYLDNATNAGRRTAVVIADDSAQPATHARCTKMLRKLAQRYDVEVAYATPPDTLAFATQLAAEAHVAADVVAFACLGSPAGGLITAGANRNVLLLHSAGEPVLSSDDDIVCRPAAAGGLGGG